MIVYEVNVDVAPALAAEYAGWLDTHIAEILALPGFVGAARYRRDVDAPAPLDERLAQDLVLNWTIHYRLRDRASLDAYMSTHAPRLRAEGIARFGAGITATRRVLETLD